MAIPDFQTLMLPLLKVAAGRDDIAVQDARDLLAGEFGLTDKEREQLLPSGRQRTFSNRVAWAAVYLAQAGLLSRPSRGRIQITGEGRSVLAAPPDRVTIRFLEQYPAFKEFRTRPSKREPTVGPAPESEEDQTPEERLEAADHALTAALERELLDRVKNVTPAFFERLVLDLLIKMGYGVAGGDAGQHLGRSGDDGVDGVIREDKLGLDVVYLQAKRWGDQPVRRPDVQAFTGSLEGQRARKGVFITTSHFTADAHEYVGRIEKRIVLIDGKQLARLMIENGVGVTTIKTYDLQRLDETFFDEAADD